MWFRGQRDELEDRLGYRFRDRERLTAALAHRSWAYEQGRAGDNERLEFLGDAVLGLVAADWLYRRYPERSEGDLARLKAWLVSEISLARHAAALGLGERVLLGANEERLGGRARSSILADALEAVFAAIWLDGGLGPARDVIERFLLETEASGEGGAPDAKTRLQELAQAAGWALPAYTIVAESGPAHDKLFVCEVVVCGEPQGRGTGRTKKEAQQRAAAEALERIASEDAEGEREPDGGAVPAEDAAHLRAPSGSEGVAPRR